MHKGSLATQSTQRSAPSLAGGKHVNVYQPHRACVTWYSLGPLAALVELLQSILQRSEVRDNYVSGMHYLSLVRSCWAPTMNGSDVDV